MLLLPANIYGVKVSSLIKRVAAVEADHRTVLYGGGEVVNVAQFFRVCAQAALMWGKLMSQRTASAVVMMVG